MHDIYKKIEEYNPNKKQKVLTVLDDMIADILCNKNLNPIITELSIRERKNFCFCHTILFCSSEKYSTKLSTFLG